MGNSTSNLSTEASMGIGAISAFGIVALLYLLNNFGIINFLGTGVSSFVGNPILLILVFIVNIAPVSLLLFGPMGDLINRGQFVSSLPSVIIIGTLILGKLFDITKFGVPNYTKTAGINETGIWCTLPGLEWFENKFFPSSLFTITLLLTYYTTWSYRMYGFTTGFIIFLCANFIFPLLLAAMVFKFGPGCSDFYVYGTYSILLAIGLGLVSLLLGSFLPVSFNPFNFRIPGSEIAGSGTPFSLTGSFSLPASGTTPWDPSNPASGKVNCPPNQTYLPATGTCVTLPSSNQSSAPSGQEQTFVAELYKNGQLVSSESIGK